jgi:hypothetical protein
MEKRKRDKLKRLHRAGPEDQGQWLRASERATIILGMWRKLSEKSEVLLRCRGSR